MQPSRNSRRRTILMTILMCPACSGTPMPCAAGEMTRSKFWHNYRLHPVAVTCRPITLPLSISVWVTKMKHCAGLKKISMIGMDGTLDLSGSIRYWTRCAAMRGFNNSRSESFRPGYTDTLARADATFMLTINEGHRCFSGSLVNSSLEPPGSWSTSWSVEIVT